MAKKRVGMEGQQSGTLQWLIGYTTKGIDSYSNRSIQKRLVGCISRGQNRRSVAQEGTGSTYQSTGTFRHNVCHLTFAKIWKISSIHIQIGSMTALSYLLKIAGTKNP